MNEKKSNPFDFKKLKKENFVVILLIGVLLLVIAWPVSDKKTDNEEAKSGITDTSSSILKLSEAEGSESGQAQIISGNELQAYAASLESTLEDILSAMEGAGRVKVMITLESSGEAIVEKDVNKEISASTEVDSEGGSRNTSSSTQTGETVYTKEGGSTAVPYVRQVMCPKIAGVVVCAQGGDNEAINKNITEAIQALFGIEVHKIKVIKMSSK